MKRVTGKIVRELRRFIAKKQGLATSEVSVFCGHEDDNSRLAYGYARRRWHISRRRTWSIFIGAQRVHHEFSWCAINSFCKDFKSR
jgi:hypothetical protein